MTEKLLNDYEDKKLNFDHNFDIIKNEIQQAAETVGKKAEDITLLAATKTVSVELVNHAIHNGIKNIGENRVQELLLKYENYDLSRAKLDFIGRLQTNKVKQIIEKVNIIQSVDRINLAETINNYSLSINKKTNVLIEVNIGNEQNKAGISPEKVVEFIYQVSELSNIRVRGIMAIPPVAENITQTRNYFYNMRQLFVDISRKKIDNVSMDYLSMGMSDDYKEAILEGSNMVRIGSLLFGKRIYI